MEVEADRIPCPMCGEMIAAAARKCRFCGEQVTSAPKGNNDAVSGLIPYKNPPALIAYYLGQFSLLPCFPIGLVALVLGIIGLRKVKAQPEARGTVHAWIGILVGGFFGLLWTVLTVGGVIAAIAESSR